LRSFPQVGIKGGIIKRIGYQLMVEPTSAGEQLDFALIDENTPQLKVVKANALIEAHYELTAKEHKLLLLGIARIAKDQQQFYEQVFSVPEVARLLGVPVTSAYAELDRISSGLMKKQVEIRNQETGEFVKYQWVTKAYCKKGDFGFRLSEDLKPYLLGLVGSYTMYELSHILPMSSGYAIRLYELLKQHGTFGSRVFSLEPELTRGKNWEDFALVMGYDRKSYPRFSNINQRILKPALSQIEIFGEFRNLKVDRVTHGRKTVAIRISWMTIDGLSSLADNPLYKELSGLGVAEKVIRDVFSRFAEDRIRRNLVYAKQAHKEKKVDNPAGYFLKAVQSDYGNPQLHLDAPDEDDNPNRDNAVGLGPDHGALYEHGAEHPLRKDCSTDAEFQLLLSAERKRGKPFVSYNEFHDYKLKEKYGTTH